MSLLRRRSVPLGLVVLGTLVVWLAPAERTLGEGIRWVYVHVALLWAGTLTLGIAAMGGLALLASGRPAGAGWVQAAWHAGLTAFGLGIAFSLVAAYVNWGAVFLAEPRMAASLRFLAVAAILAVAGTWLVRPRCTGGLAALTFALLLWKVGGAELVMHPDDPVRTATSAAIQSTFAACFMIATGLTAWTAVWLRVRRSAVDPGAHRAA